MSKLVFSMIDATATIVEVYVRRIAALERILDTYNSDNDKANDELAYLRAKNGSLLDENANLLNEVKELRKLLDQSQSETYQARENLTRCMSYDDSKRVVAGFLNFCEMYLMSDGSYMISRIGLIKATKMCLGLGLKESKEFTDNNLNTREARKYCNM